MKNIVLETKGYVNFISFPVTHFFLDIGLFFI